MTSDSLSGEQSHLQAYAARRVLALPFGKSHGWQIKQYAILADGRSLDTAVTQAALEAAGTRLPVAGRLEDPDGNHGIGFQIIHFAQVAVVSPVFYWQWGSVLARIDQVRAPWDRPTAFDTGMSEVVGCVWEMEIVAFEVRAWAGTLLGVDGTAEQRVKRYLSRIATAAQ